MSFVVRAAARALSGGIRAMSTSASVNGVPVEVNGRPRKQALNFTTLVPLWGALVAAFAALSRLQIAHFCPCYKTNQRSLRCRCTTPAAACGW